MVDDFMVCVDRIIVASTCFESVHNGERDRNRSDGDGVGIGATSKDGNVSEGLVSVKGNEEGSSCSLKKVEMVECRICQEEAEVLAMEAPCACNGTLKVFTFLLWVFNLFSHLFLVCSLLYFFLLFIGFFGCEFFKFFANVFVDFDF